MKKLAVTCIIVGTFMILFCVSRGISSAIDRISIRTRAQVGVAGALSAYQTERK